jgi:cobalt-zinc-cadmium efflux system protein
MSHGHHDRRGSKRRLAVTFCLTASYMVAEIVGGIMSGSLALLADAGHMLSDSVALALALAAAWVAERPRSRAQTYGYGRTEVLAALANGAILVLVAAGVVLEAIERLQAPTAIIGPIAVAVASGGLVMNLVAMRILRHGEHASINERGAFLHVVSDALGSVGALTAGALAWAFGWHWPDSVASLLIAMLVLRAGWLLIRETVSVLMERVPSHLDAGIVTAALEEIEGVEDVHDLHIWTITTHQVCLSAHVVSEEEDAAHLLDRIHQLLRERFRIEHATIQLENRHYVEEHCAASCAAFVAGKTAMPASGKPRRQPGSASVRKKALSVGSL